MTERSDGVLGADLALTRYSGTAGSVPLESADSWGSLDVMLVPGGRTGVRPSAAADRLDLTTVRGRANLGQALILRLLTPVGALTHLGHPAYGSRLVELIGSRNNETTRHLARLFTLQTLNAEPRIKKVQRLDVVTDRDQPDVIRIEMTVLPVGDDEPLALGLDVAL